MRNYRRPQNLLSTNNAKTIKGEGKGYRTFILYLAPHTQNSRGINLCSHASEGCAKACLFGSGAARFDRVQAGKTNKTEYFLSNRTEFLNQLDGQISAIERNAKDFIPTIRLNGTSDIAWEKFKIRDGKNIFELHPSIIFYDYTKNHLRMRKELPSNYHLTFSLSENNLDIAMQLLSEGKNVAMVFGVKKASQLPSQYLGYQVINGDEDDLRFLDAKNVIVGLKYKNLTGLGSKGKNDFSENDFIIKVDEIQTLKIAI